MCICIPCTAIVVDIGLVLAVMPCTPAYVACNVMPDNLRSLFRVFSSEPISADSIC